MLNKEESNMKTTAPKLTQPQLEALVYVIATSKCLRGGRREVLEVTHFQNISVPSRTFLALVRKGAFTGHPYRVEDGVRVYEDWWGEDPWREQPVESRLAAWVYDLIDVDAVKPKLVSYSMHRRPNLKTYRVWNYDPTPYIRGSAAQVAS